MKLALQHTDNSPYTRCGIFIKHASPKVWLEEIKRMQLKLSDCTLYPCPGTEANSISGVLIIFKTAQKKVDVMQNLCVQRVQTGFFIPENTKLNMALRQEEFAKLLKGKPHFFHHQFGLIELEEEVQWEELLNVPEEQFPKLETPAKGVNIPMQVTAFSVEIEEEETEKELNNPFSSEQIDPKHLPFDMKRVLEGNNKEVEKYLKYLDKNPEAALKMAVPLDMMGTSRGKAFAKYKFKSNFFDDIGLGNISEQTKTNLKTVLGILAIIAVFWIGYYVVDQVKKQQVEVVTGKEQFNSENNRKFSLEGVLEEGGKTTSETLPIDNETDTDTGNYNITNEHNKEATPSPTSTLIKSFGIGIVCLIAFIVFVLYFTSKKVKDTKTKSKSDNKPTSWMDLPEENELFSFTEEVENKESDFYFGGNELSIQSKILLVIMLISLLIYLFYPMLTKPGIGTIFFLMTIAFVIRLLYLLTNKNKTIIDD